MEENAAQIPLQVIIFAKWHIRQILDICLDID